MEKWMGLLLFLAGVGAGQYLGLSPLYSAGLGLMAAAVGTGGGFIAAVKGFVTDVISKAAVILGAGFFSLGIWFATANIWIDAASKKSPFILIASCGAIAMVLLAIAGLTKWSLMKSILVYGNGIMLTLALLAILSPSTYSAISGMVSKTSASSRTRLVAVEKGFMPTSKQGEITLDNVWQVIPLNGDTAWLTPSTKVVFKGATVSPPPPDIEWVLSSDPSTKIAASPAQGSSEIVIEPFRSVDTRALLAEEVAFSVRVKNGGTWKVNMNVEEVKEFYESGIIELPERRKSAGVAFDAQDKPLEMHRGDRICVLGFEQGKGLQKSTVNFYGMELLNDVPSKWIPVHSSGTIVATNKGGLHTKVVVRVHHTHPPGKGR